MTARSFAFALCLCAFAPAIPWAQGDGKKDFDGEIAGQKRELESIRARLVKERQELKELSARKNVTLGQLEKLSENLRLTEEYLKKLERTEETLNQSLTATQRDLGQVEGRIRERNVIMARRVRALFISGGPDRFVLGSLAPERGDFFSKAYFMKRVLRYDRNLVDAGRDDAEIKKKSLARMDAKMDELNRFRSHKAEEMGTYSRAKGEQEKLLRELQSSESAKSRALRKLEENARLLNNIIATLEKRRKEETVRSKKATVLETGSKFCLPVQGEVVSKYGLQYHASLKTTTKNLGVEIEGRSGAPVRAAVSGEVAMITQIPGYGPGVILDNGSNYFTIYANLSGIKVKQGEKVATCQDIASVSSDPNRVYFEVRKGTRTLDPLKWLRSPGE